MNKITIPGFKITKSAAIVLLELAKVQGCSVDDLVHEIFLTGLAERGEAIKSEGELFYVG